AWPLPQLAFLRNVYWDAASERLANDQPLEAGDDWLPSSLPAAVPVQPQAHRVDLPGGQTVLAIPAGLVDLPELPAGLSLAVVLDRSRSMQAHAEEVTEILQQLQGMQGLEAPVDVYLTASPYRGEEPSVASLEALDPQEVLYFGGQNSAQLVNQFAGLKRTSRSQRQYQAVVVITDGSGYELGDSQVQLPVPDAPIWVVHVGGQMPLGYDDQTLKAIQSSGGGVAGSLEEALERIAVALDGSSGAGTDLLDGYLWRLLPANEAASALPGGVAVNVHAADDPFAALAARRLTLAEMQRQRGTIDDLATLDALHALGLEYQIVTPYSSMIVLVDARQQNLLDKLSGQTDRYQREFEELGETTPGSPLPLAGVPEPHEWLLLALAAALLVYLIYTRRRNELGATGFLRPTR
ncbi:MAG TPA: TIGR02921 family PEP-CTERM protein, partial [Anaerolineales bacterium]|nr:TIGR02921 family PEP-CTERM protein [Anaerolineales bacterium]